MKVEANGGVVCEKKKKNVNLQIYRRRQNIHVRIRTFVTGKEPGPETGVGCLSLLTQTQ